MALAPGTRIGPYQVTATIGAGGMGEVYRALDTSLDRIRLFESILRVLDRLTRRSPVVLFIHDLPWADRSTLELLAYVTRDLTSSRA